MTIEANSDARLARLTRMVEAALPEARRLGEERRTLAELRAEDPAPADEAPTDLEADPEVRAVMEDLMIRYAERWVSEPVPALGGLTPHEAVGDPTRREDLEALLREMDRAARAPMASGAGMPVGRIRELLGLGAA